MNRLDGKGYHPKVRLYVPHGKYGRIIRKIKLATPAAWQLAMIRQGMRFVALRHDSLELADLATSEAALFEPSYIEVGCADTRAWYVDTTGCGMLQANQANPPPKESFVSKALHKTKGFIMNLGKVLSLAGLMALANACGKDPVPTPEPEPHTYPETVYVPFEWNIYNPNIDTIKFYADKPEVKRIVMDLLPMDSLCTSGWYWAPFHSARDTLQKRIDIAPDKVCGRGTIIVWRIIPDSLTWYDGLPRSDSIAFTKMGFDIYAHKH